MGEVCACTGVTTPAPRTAAASTPSKRTIVLERWSCRKFECILNRLLRVKCFCLVLRGTWVECWATLTRNPGSGQWSGKSEVLARVWRNKIRIYNYLRNLIA